MTYVPFVSAAIFAALGILHLVYTVHDAIRTPKYFAPDNKTLLPAMRATRMALAPGGHDYWDAIIGFHFSHSIGVLLLATMIAVEAAHPTGWLRPVLCGTGALYTLIAWRYWFDVPLIGVAIATIAMTLAWIVW